MSNLTKAVSILEAVKLSEHEYAHYDSGTCRWYVVDDHDLSKLPEYMKDRPFGYSRWCADTDAKEMPEGWVP